MCQGNVRSCPREALAELRLLRQCTARQRLRGRIAAAIVQRFGGLRCHRSRCLFARSRLRENTTCDRLLPCARRRTRQSYCRFGCDSWRGIAGFGHGEKSPLRNASTLEHVEPCTLKACNSGPSQDRLPQAETFGAQRAGRNPGSLRFRSY